MQQVVPEVNGQSWAVNIECVRIVPACESETWAGTCRTRDREREKRPHMHRWGVKRAGPR